MIRKTASYKHAVYSSQAVSVAKQAHDKRLHRIANSTTGTHEQHYMHTATQPCNGVHGANIKPWIHQDLIAPNGPGTSDNMQDDMPIQRTPDTCRHTQLHVHANSSLVATAINAPLSLQLLFAKAAQATATYLADRKPKTKCYQTVVLHAQPAVKGDNW